MNNVFKDFKDAIDYAREKLLNDSYIIKTEKWQGIELKHPMRETLNTSFSCLISPSTEVLQFEIRPNIPWANIHFKERVGQEPLNPGESYKEWPFYKMDKEMRTERGKFSHTYMERIWQKYAGQDPNFPIVNLLSKEPHTRQAYLPIWFPEDTGVLHGGRVPCTLGYHFIMRDNRLHIIYYIRSCDYLRHFRDDIYLACMKVLWVLEELKEIGGYSGEWMDVKPGTLTMHITSLHIFQNEYELVKRYKK